MNLFTVPRIQALRRYQRVRRGVGEFLYLLVLLSAIGITRADDAGLPASNVERSAQSKEVTYRGCLIYNRQRKALVLVTRDDEAFDLTGKASLFPTHAFYLPVSVRGIELSPPKSDLGGDLPSKLEVKYLQVPTPVAELNKSITDVSQWIRKTDETYGVRLAAPKLASFQRTDSLVPPDLLEGTIRAMDIGFPIYPKGGAGDGRVVIYVSTATNEKDTYRAGKKIEWINGFKYTECVAEGEIRFNVCSVYTFQNNLSYRFNFWFHVGQLGVVEWECLDPPINRSQEQSFIRLFSRSYLPSTRSSHR
jgi:hypothetical protein